MAWKFETDIFATDAPITRGDEVMTHTEKTVKALSCGDCPLNLSCKTPKLPFIGEGALGVLILGSYPSKDEDITGELGHGCPFEFLADTLKTLNIDILKDCYYMTAVSCRTPKDRDPALREVQCCSSRIQSVIKKLKPRSIILLGQGAFNSIIYPKMTGRIGGTGWEKFCGDIIPDQEYGIHLIPTWDAKHFLSRKQYDDGSEGKPLFEQDKAWYTLWQKHLMSAFNTPVIVKNNYAHDCFTTTKVETAIGWIIDALEWKHVSFDYETNSIKSQRKGARLLAVSISNGLFSFAFPVFEDEVFRKALKKLLTSKIKKIAHNASFEWAWTKSILGYYPQNLHWDTMLGQHCLANTKPTGLKFCTYVTCGDIGYDDGIDKYLKSDPQEDELYGDNAFNKLDQAPIEDMLLYNALDSLYTAKIYEQQKGRMTETQMQGFQLFLDSTLSFVKMHNNGVHINMEKFEEVKHELELKLASADRAIMESEEVARWDGTTFNHKSSTQLAHLLFDILGVKSVTTTSSGKPAVDKDTLPKLEHPLVPKILAYRELDKMLGTYIGQYSREIIDGKIHSFTNLNRVETFRTSMSSVNWQNQIKRNKEAKKYLRSYVMPSPGCRIIELDHSQLEVRINACYSGDKNLINFIENGLDMHTLSTQEAFLLKPEEVKKEYRDKIKGLFVFASFYGSVYFQIAKDLWEYVQSNELKDHLASKGVKTYVQFEEQIKEAERILWEERFPQHAEWRKNMWKFYQKHGYIEAYTGFKIYGPMRRNNSFNSNVQGSAAHILLTGINYLQEQMEKKLERSTLLFQIHDALIASVAPEEEDHYDYMAWYFCTQRVREVFPWINVPLVMEKERSEINGVWSEMTSCGKLHFE